MSKLKERLKNGEAVIGTMVTLFEKAEISKLIKVSGFDFFIIDCEHGNFDYSTVAGILGMAREAGIPGLVRIPEVKREVVLKYMEMGAQGLLLPNTETADQAKALVEYSKYAPLGNRGVALMREHTGFEKPESVTVYMQDANEKTILMVQIESTAGINNIDSILDVEGIDAAFIGPNDLSQSMGIMGQINSPVFIEAVDKVIETASKKGKFSGIHLASPAALKPWISKGMSLNLWSSDINILIGAAQEGLTELR
ncbi:aldolase/citrate lyase family protein [Petroclostridium sp. X23]|uniref:HpcH/HpaI aldolase family protein n=1 Tax=Petroclostridium sp. X23 TaxID=3045146 RepID=UPI0024ADCB6F|nr:aldolase/citrate lyase family protein [Petroclostridium sp. X23]WHH61015.1 aldolase/citrate lyase family protein [Petroclostridium sp. X23]